MALKDSEAAVRVMQSAVEAKRLALGPSHPAVTESVLGLAAIFRASGRNQNAIDVIEKELQFLTQEGLKAFPGEIPHSQCLPPPSISLEPPPIFALHQCTACNCDSLWVVHRDLVDLCRSADADEEAGGGSEGSRHAARG